MAYIRIEGYSGSSGFSGLTGYSGLSGYTGLHGFSGIWDHFDNAFKEMDNVFSEQSVHVDKISEHINKIEIEKMFVENSSSNEPKYLLNKPFKLPKIPKKVFYYLIPIFMGAAALLLLHIIEKMAIK